MRDRDGERAAIADGYVSPIAGLLALLFALMPGITVSHALSGTLQTSRSR